MISACRFVGAGLLLILLAPAGGAPPAKPVSEPDLVKLIELQIGDEVVVAKLKKDGVGFHLDDAAAGRLKAAGASDAVLAAARAAAAPGAAPGGKAITYADVLDLVKLGIPEPKILERLAKSPTVFTLDAAQVDELKAAGAGEALLTAMQGGRKSATPIGEVTDLAIILDCSASMAEATKDGSTKMATAKKVVTDLVQKIPDGLNLAFLIYGHEKDNRCEAVRVVRPSSPLDAAGKAALTQTIAGLQPVGNTPIALALRTAGAELAGAKGTAGLVLITDGKETCNGDPAAEATTLAAPGNLSFGLNVVGFDVEGEERASLEEIARVGKGKYYNAASAAELRDVIQAVRKTIEVAARPAVAQSIKLRRAVRTVKLLAPKVELPPMKEFIVVKAGDSPPYAVLASGTQYGAEVRLPADSKVAKFDIRWKGRDFEASQAIFRDVTVDESGALELRPEDGLGMVQVVGTGLPRPKVVSLVKAGDTPPYGIFQSCDRFGPIMPVAAGVYDLRFIPADGDASERLVENLEVKAGKLVKIE